MHTGAITDYMDVAQMTLYVFWLFFAALVIYLRREDKREGYPLESSRSRQIRIEGWPPLPKPKTSPFTTTSTSNVFRCSGPLVATVR
jgi:photosynthetic reaction center H subunit